MKERIGAYEFRYCHDVDSPDKVRVYVEQQPDYNGRPTDDHSTHRIFSGGGAPPHICIKEHCKPDTLGEAQQLARDWVGYTERHRNS